MWHGRTDKLWLYNSHATNRSCPWLIVLIVLQNEAKINRQHFLAKQWPVSHMYWGKKLVPCFRKYRRNINLAKYKELLKSYKSLAMSTVPSLTPWKITYRFRDFFSRINHVVGICWNTPPGSPTNQKNTFLVEDFYFVIFLLTTVNF